MVEAMLEPHLKRNAGATQTDVGITFLIYGSVYMISSPIAGLVCPEYVYMHKYVYRLIQNLSTLYSCSISWRFAKPKILECIKA